MTQLTQEFLAGPSAAAVPNSEHARAIEVQNLGPDPIYCSLGDGTSLAVGNGREIPPGGVWALNLWFADDYRYGVRLYIICATLQVTGAATIVTEL